MAIRQNFFQLYFSIPMFGARELGFIDPCLWRRMGDIVIGTASGLLSGFYFFHVGFCYLEWPHHALFLRSV